MAVLLVSFLPGKKKSHYSANKEDVLAKVMSIEGAVDKSDVWVTPASLIIAGFGSLLMMMFIHGSALPAGLFMPAMFVGACAGGSMGFLIVFVLQKIGLEDVANDIQPGSYALVGATAALAGIFRSAISLVVIVIEGIGDISFMLPIIIAVAMAKWMGDNFSESFYDAALSLKKIPFLHPTLPESTSFEKVNDTNYN